MRDIKDLLTAWGNWARERIGTEYPSGWPIVQPSSDMRPMLSDSEAEIVDRAVRRLKEFDEISHDVVLAHYCWRLSLKAISKTIQRHHSYVYSRLDSAEAYIAGYVHENLLLA